MDKTCYYFCMLPQLCTECPEEMGECQVIDDGGCWAECEDGKQSKHHQAKTAKTLEIRGVVCEYLSKDSTYLTTLMKDKTVRTQLTKIIKKHL